MIRAFFQTLFIVFFLAQFAYLLNETLYLRCEQNLWTWLGWSIINFTLLRNLYVQKGNWIPVLCYLVGNILITIALSYGIYITHAWPEIGFLQLIIIAAAAISFGAWLFLPKKSIAATWTITLAIFLCGTLNSLSIFEDAHKGPAVWQCLVFILINALSFAFVKKVSTPQIVPSIFGTMTWILALLAKIFGHHHG